jgi:hypothetical protein
MVSLRNVLLAAVTALAGATQVDAANVLVNGSFEDGPADNFSGYHRGPPPPTGWTALAGYEVPDQISNSYTQNGAGFQRLLLAYDGNRMIDPNGASATGGMFQDVSGLTVGSLATLTYYTGRWLQNSGGSLVASLIDASNGAVINSNTTVIIADPSAQSAQWMRMSFSALVPSSGILRVQFFGNSGSTSLGAPGLDAVSLDAAPIASAVPEPASWAVMIVGFGMVGATLRSARRPSVRAA